MTPGRVVAVSLLAIVPAIAVSAWRLPWSRLVFARSELWSDVKFGVKAAAGTLLRQANLRLDVLVMSAVLAASQVGFYTAANTVAFPLAIVAWAAGLLLFPRVAHAHVEDGDVDVVARQLALLRREWRRLAAASVALGLALAVFSPSLVPVVLGRAYAPVGGLVLLLVPGYVAMTYVMLASGTAVAMRRPWVANVAEGVGLAVTVTLLPLLVTRYQARGAAITSSLAYTVTALVVAVSLRSIARRGAEARRLHVMEGDGRRREQHGEGGRERPEALGPARTF
jgi:O-antigen/teichoic acid export membrane protein